jgi:transcriptional regulator with XRE-family HTH domain
VLAARPREGVISGQALKIVRESVGATQEGLAELLEVDPNTVQSWESGRRGLPGTRVATLNELRRQLHLLGAAESALAALLPAVEADYLLRFVIDTDPLETPLDRHPLAASVLRRDVVDLLAWPFTDTPPSGLPAATSRRNGPRSSSPAVSVAEREAFFAHLQTVVERSRRFNPGPADPQPHRQIYYFMQWDPRASTQDWVQAMERAERRCWPASHGWTPRWVTARSAAITQARHGDPEPLRAFIAAGLADQEDCEDADLNYWAYWLGETSASWRRDEAMADGLHRWAGYGLLERFSDRLVPDEPLLDLYAHSTAALVVRRPHLLRERSMAVGLATKIQLALESAGLGTHTRRRLEDIRFALRLNTE